MEQVLSYITQCKLDVILCAFLTTVITGVVKMPIKKVADISGDSKRITKYITFLPIVIGFGIALLYTYFENTVIVFEQSFFARWLSSVSLSLAIYAFWEKFVPSKKKILTDAEIAANRAAIQEIENILQLRNGENSVSDNLQVDDGNHVNETDSAPEIDCGTVETIAQEKAMEENSFQNKIVKKIVLRGGNHAEIAQE